MYQLSGQIAVETVVVEALPPGRIRRESTNVTVGPSFQRYLIRRSSTEPEMWTSGSRDRQVARSDDPLTRSFHIPARGRLSSPARPKEIQHARSRRRTGVLHFMGNLLLVWNGSGGFGWRGCGPPPIVLPNI
jgi:hypothetical protein